MYKNWHQPKKQLLLLISNSDHSVNKNKWQLRLFVILSNEDIKDDVISHHKTILPFPVVWLDR